MPAYVALLRGIGPGNPNMRNDKLRGLFEQLGFKKVQTVISSGNVLFESPSTNIRALEKTIEEALPERLGFTSTTIIRSQQQLQQLVDRDPFKGTEHSPKTNLNVTFLKNEPKSPVVLQAAKDRGYEIVGQYDRAICSVIDLTGARTPDLMSWLEKQLGKEITTRTWKTVMRVLSKMQAAA